MPQVLHFADVSSSSAGRGATIRLDSGETCTVSVAQAGVLVKKSRYGFFGAILYSEKNVYNAAKTAAQLDLRFPDSLVPHGFTDPVLSAFVNAVMHCATSAAVAVTLNETVKVPPLRMAAAETRAPEVTAKTIVDGALDAVAQLGELMEAYPHSVLDTSLLPLPKPEMKRALKIVWRVAPDEHVRNCAETGYIFLAHFQDGVGPQPISGEIPAGADPKTAIKILDPYLAWSPKMKAEIELLYAELEQFKGSAG